MTQAQILGRFPGARLTDFTNLSDKVGVTKVIIIFKDHPQQRGDWAYDLWTEVKKSNFPDFKDVHSLDISFLDKRVCRISITYDGTIDWDNTSEFASSVSEALGLPAAWEEREGDRQGQDLDCQGFRLTAWVKTTSPRGASLFLADKAAEGIIDNRERKRTFKP